MPTHPAKPYRFGKEAAPRLLPHTYPGVWPPCDTIITAPTLYEIWHPTPPTTPPAPLAGYTAFDGGYDTTTLGEVLAVHNAAPLAGRVPVVAVGSNAAPSQLRHKWWAAGDPAGLCIPQLWATIPDFAAVYAPFAAPYGSIPATAARGHTPAHLPVQLLDATQLAGLDATEYPHYKRVWVPGTVTLGTGHTLTGVYAYVAHAGCLAGSSGDPIGVAAEKQPTGLTQTELLDTLGLPHDAAPATTNAAIAAHGHPLPNPLLALPDEAGVAIPAARYFAG